MSPSEKMIATIVFDRHEMKDALEASSVRIALREYERWLHNCLDQDFDDGWMCAMEEARNKLFDVFNDWGVNVWED